MDCKRLGKLAAMSAAAGLPGNMYGQNWFNEEKSNFAPPPAPAAGAPAAGKSMGSLGGGNPYAAPAQAGSAPKAENPYGTGMNAGISKAIAPAVGGAMDMGANFVGASPEFKNSQGWNVAKAVVPAIAPPVAEYGAAQAAVSSGLKRFATANPAMGQTFLHAAPGMAGTAARMGASAGVGTIASAVAEPILNMASTGRPFEQQQDFDESTIPTSAGSAAMSALKGWGQPLQSGYTVARDLGSLGRTGWDAATGGSDSSRRLQMMNDPQHFRRTLDAQYDYSPGIKSMWTRTNDGRYYPTQQYMNQTSPEDYARMQQQLPYLPQDPRLYFAQQ